MAVSIPVAARQRDLRCHRGFGDYRIQIHPLTVDFGNITRSSELVQPITAEVHEDFVIVQNLVDVSLFAEVQAILAVFIRIQK